MVAVLERAEDFYGHDGAVAAGGAGVEVLVNQCGDVCTRRRHRR